MAKKKWSGPMRLFFAITDPIVVAFAFFWGTVGQFLIPILHLIYFVAIFFVFIPVIFDISPIAKLPLKELLEIRILALFYLLADFGLAVLLNGFIGGVKKTLKKLLIFVLVYLLVGIILAVAKRLTI